MPLTLACSLAQYCQVQDSCKAYLEWWLVVCILMPSALTPPLSLPSEGPADVHFILFIPLLNLRLS